MTTLTDRELLVLSRVHQRNSIREMAEALGSGHSAVEEALAKLEREGYVQNPPGRLARMRSLTPKGLQALKLAGLLTG